ncbi:hypothetical protein C8J56DRAFT_960731 [Mycena floridula]|nr:hypothetical protein C8J56DRAFT_960731 [Mycena floridula]
MTMAAAALFRSFLLSLISAISFICYVGCLGSGDSVPGSLACPAIPGDAVAVSLSAANVLQVPWSCGLVCWNRAKLWPAASEIPIQ